MTAPAQPRHAHPSEADTGRYAGEARLLDAMLALVRGIDRVHSSGVLVDRSGVTLERGLHPVVMTIAKLEPVRTTELASALALKSSTVSRHLARLEQLGLVQRTGDPADARASLLTLSQDGRRIHSVLNAAWAEILSEQLALAGSGDASVLADELGKVAHALELLPVPGEAGTGDPA
jgi:DNA-binding MarR family transcriptional regulator